MQLRCVYVCVCKVALPPSFPSIAKADWLLFLLNMENGHLLITLVNIYTQRTSRGTHAYIPSLLTLTGRELAMLHQLATEPMYVIIRTKTNGPDRGLLSRVG